MNAVARYFAVTQRKDEYNNTIVHLPLTVVLAAFVALGGFAAKQQCDIIKLQRDTTAILTRLSISLEKDHVALTREQLAQRRLLESIRNMLAEREGNHKNE